MPAFTHLSTHIWARCIPNGNQVAYYHIGKPDASVTWSPHANQRSAPSPRPTPEGPARDDLTAKPQTGTTRSEPSAPASAGASGRHNEPGSRPASTCPVQPPSKAGGASPRGGEKHQRFRKSRPEHRERLDRTRRGAPPRGHKARQRGTPPATTKAHGQLPSSNGRRVPQTRRARTTRCEPRHENRVPARIAAVQTNMCAPGSEPSPCQLRSSPRQDGRVPVQRVLSPCWLQTAAVRMDECTPGGYQAPAGYE